MNVDFAARYNIAPRQYVETIVNDGAELRIGPMRWLGTGLFRAAYERDLEGIVAKQRDARGG